MLRTSKLIWSVGLILIGLVLPLWLGLTGHPDLSVSVRPLRTHAGAIQRDAAPGQTFRCEGQGLERIEVALVSLGSPEDGLELVLRAESVKGEVLRRVSLYPGELTAPEFVSFSFEPIEESAGRWFHFQLLPNGERTIANYSPWIRFHGQTGRDDPWGETSLHEQVVRNYFQSPLGDLRALGIACEFLSTEGGAIHFELWDLDDGGKTRRELTLPTPSVVHNGYAFFDFEPVPESKGRNYGYRIKSKGPARFNARFGKPTIKTLHGVAAELSSLRGMSSGNHSLGSRDLVFQTWTSFDWERGLRLALARAGWRLWAAIACWAFAVYALGRFLFRDTRAE